VVEKEASAEIAGMIERMTQDEIDQETSTHHQRTYSMDLAVYITHTLMANESPIT
jgi:hypothetical protein